MENKQNERSGFAIDIDRLMRVMSEILSDVHGCRITMTAIPKTREGGDAA